MKHTLKLTLVLFTTLVAAVMSGLKVGKRFSPRLLTASMVLFIVGFALLFTQRSQGQAPGTLKFFKNYFVTGEHRVYGIGLKGAGTDGFATATIDIPLSSVPPNGEAIAAYLYWSTVVTKTTPNQGLTGATFKGNDISELAQILNPLGTSPCWSSGGGTGTPDGSKMIVIHRVDVLRHFQDSNGQIVIDGAHEVHLPSNSGGNVTPFTLGASLLVVFRTHSPTSNPLRSIVIYDGGVTMDQGSSGVSTVIKGFYQPSFAQADRQVSLSMIFGDGQDNFSEQVKFNGTAVATNPFTSALGDAWDNPTISIPAQLLPGSASEASITVEPTGSNFDCVTGGAMILSTTVEDTDQDGLLNVWETTSGLVDPNDQPLPNLPAMGADPLRKDAFLEIAYMVANPGTQYGTGSAKVTDTAGHHHRPTIGVLKVVADMFQNAPVKNPYEGCGPAAPHPCGPTGIKLHVDIGNAGQTVADDHIIPANLARGGEAILEKACVPTLTEPCAFPDYPGTVGWKVGFQFLKDQPVANDGSELSAEAEAVCRESGTCRQRFDSVRKDMFHLGVHAHALGVRKSEDPASPNYSVPRSISGMGDFPGGDYIETLGFWGNGFRGPDFVQATTKSHELGHNFWLTHSGDLFSRPTGPFELNCNPNYLSIMSYLFQIPGVLTQTGVSTIDFSRTALDPLSESNLTMTLSDGPLDYRAAWYAPKSSVHQSLGTTIATRHCDGSPLNPGEQFIRIDGTGVNTPPTDWNGDLIANDEGRQQDVTFDGNMHNNSEQELLRGSADWSFVASTGLRQLGSRRNGGGYSVDGKDYGGKDYGGKDYGGKDYGGKDYGGKDYGGKDYGGDQDFDHANSVAHPAHSLKAALGVKSVILTWKPPNLSPVGGVKEYLAYRVTGETVVGDGNFTKRTLVGKTTNTTITDTRIKAGETYTYWIIVSNNSGSTSAMSNQETITIPK